jgi:Caudovirus prohead serine protease
MRFYWPIAKVDGELQMVWGYASTEAEDEQGETVTRNALSAALDDYMRFANIREMHQNSAVGVAKQAEIDGKGLYLGAKIIDPAAWTKVVEGVYKGFSIGGRVTARDPADRKIITGLTLTEISIVDRPANPEAVFDCWKLALGAAAVDGAREDPYGNVDYADPGYQPDAKRRYPIYTERHIRAAWAFINQQQNARRYTTAQLDRVKARIIAAWQAKIDRAGPPAAAAPDAARKDSAVFERLQCLAADLAWLDRYVADDTRSPLADPLRGLIAELYELLAAVFDEANVEPGEDMSSHGAELAAMALAGKLRKAQQAQLAPLAEGLAKLAGEIMPRLDAMRDRIEQIARMPLPPQTAARGFAGITKREDAGGAAPGPDDIVAALARMSGEERTLTLIKAAHAAPIVNTNAWPGPSTR